MKQIHEVSGISKQAHYQYNKRFKSKKEQESKVIESILEVRSMHPVMGLRKMYDKLEPDWIGRDRFIAIGMRNGLAAKKKKNYRRTTFSNKSYQFVNLLVDKKIQDINTVWVSDITHFRVGSRFYYITLIADVYSRRIIGYHVSSNMQAENNCQALSMAFKNRRGMDLSNLIHHSDRGSQYTSDKYIKMLIDRAIGVSMCSCVYENSHIERLNGIIKNEYLIHYKIKTLEDLKRFVRKAVNLYNNSRPHDNLSRMMPIEFEQSLQNISIDKRPVMKIYTEETNTAEKSINNAE